MKNDNSQPMLFFYIRKQAPPSPKSPVIGQIVYLEKSHILRALNISFQKSKQTPSMNFF